MAVPAVPLLRPHDQELVQRFVAQATADDRLVAVALVGSHAAERADAHSDLDPLLVTEDEAYERFIVDRDSVLESIGGVLFSESFGRPERWFFVFESGADGDLTVVPLAEAAHAFSGPFVVLLDKRGALANARMATPEPVVTGAEHLETLSRQLAWFWHDFAHFVTAYARGQRWWANGQLEVLRGICAKLLRLSANLADPEVQSEPYWALTEVVEGEGLIADQFAEDAGDEDLAAGGGVQRLGRRV